MPNMVTSVTQMTMKSSRTIGAGEFKATCLALLDEVDQRGGTIVVTKRGRPVARLIPIEATLSTTLVGSLLEEDDLLSPVDVEWAAAR